MNRRNFLKGLVCTGVVAIANPIPVLIEDISQCAITVRPSFDELIATSLKLYAPKMRDNLFESKSIVWWQLRQRGYGFKESGSLIEPIIYGEIDESIDRLRI